MRTISTLAAMLMLGGISCAYAQGGPSEEPRGASERGSSAGQERGSRFRSSERFSPVTRGPSRLAINRMDRSRARLISPRVVKNPTTKDAAQSAGEKSTSESAKSDSEGGSGRMSDDKKSGSSENPQRAKIAPIRHAQPQARVVTRVKRARRRASPQAPRRSSRRKAKPRRTASGK